MEKEILEKAKQLEEKINNAQTNINKLDKLLSSAENIKLTNYNVDFYLSDEEKNMILPILKFRRTEELKKLESEFDEL